MSNKLKPCPFCGDKPVYEDDGSCINISCCCHMYMQKYDIFYEVGKPELKNFWNEKKWRYCRIGENICKEYMTKKWNTRNKKEKKQ